PAGSTTSESTNCAAAPFPRPRGGSTCTAAPCSAFWRSARHAEQAGRNGPDQNRRREDFMRHRWLVALAMVLAGASQASSQNWPSKPVRIIVPVTAGSATDVTARLVADHLTQQLGQPFVVENRTGAGGTTGM